MQNALLLIDDKSNPDGIAAGLVLASNILGVNENLLTGIGLAFGAIRTGNIPDLISAVGSLAAFNPRILNAIAGQGAALWWFTPSGLGLGALGGMNFDIASALNFVNSITKIFDCDPDPECSPNDSHTMQSGGGSSDKPSTSSIAESAKNISNSVGERKSYGTSIEKLSSSKEGVTIKKVFAKPKSRTKDLTNLVGYVNGQPYYGDFHIHTRDDGSVVKMVGIAHTTTPHDVIFDTVQESSRIMPITQTSFDNIKVGYISETDGYIQNVSIADANAYAELNPDTEFIFIDGDEKVRFLTINEVNALTPKNLLRSDPCLTGDQPCNPTKT